MELLIQASYFAAAVLFILGLKQMSSPVTARRGIVWAGAGMVLATLVFVPLSILVYPLPFPLRFRIVAQWAVFNLFWLKINMLHKHIKFMILHSTRSDVNE